MFQNINGLQANGQNMHKLKENHRIFAKERPDLQVYIETGINGSKDAILHSDKLAVAAENKIQNQPKVRDQYQHNGKGTIILKRKDVETQQTRKAFNNDKIISTQVLFNKGTAKQSKMIVGAIHSKSQNTFLKWEQLKEQLHLAKKSYKDPQIWYVDVNLDSATPRLRSS